MVQGQSIAPNSDKTMRVPGAVNEFGEASTRSINPSEYMGMSFSYQKWLDEKKKEYDTKEKDKITAVKDMLINDTEAAARAEKNIEDYKSAPGYNKEAYDKLIAENNKKHEEWNASHAPTTGGSFKYLESGLDKYNKEVSDAKNDMKLHHDEMSKSLNTEDYRKAKAGYDEAIAKLDEVTKLNPASAEGKEKYKDEIKTGWNKGQIFAAGWGVGGYHGYGEGSAARADQLLANVTGSGVGGAKPMVLKTPTETMTDLGYKLIKDPETGEMGWFGFKEVKDDKGNSAQKLEKYTGEIPQGIKFIDSGVSADVLKNMLINFNKTGQKPTNDQLTDAAKAAMVSDTIKQQNQLMNLVSYAKMFPTDSNKAKISEYANAISDPAGANKRYDDILKGLKTASGVVDKPMTSNFGTYTGNVLGRDIYSNKEGKEYVVSGGNQIPLSELTENRQRAGKTGEYTLFNFPGIGGDTNLMAQSEASKQWLATKFGEAGKITEPTLLRVGDVKVDNVILPIVQSDGREYVKPISGSLIPLSQITELKNLSTKSGEFAYNDDLYNQEMGIIKSYKEYSINKTPENRVAVEIAIQNARTNPLFTPEKITRVFNIASTGSILAGMTKDDDNNIKSDSNIAKGILSFVSKSPLDNAVASKFLSYENANKPVIRDVIQKMPKYGDPMIGVIKLNRTIDSNTGTNEDLDLIDRKSEGYDKLINRLALTTASSHIPYNENPYFGVLQNTKIKQEDPNAFDERDYNITEVTPTFSFNKNQQYVIKGIGDVSPVVANVTNKNTIPTFTNKTPARTSLDNALVFKKKGTEGLGFGINTTGLNVESLYRKSKKSKPKADIKSKKKPNKKNKTSDEFSKLTKSISKFTISLPSLKKKSKKK